ncbi:hypothetical protein [Epilithonimonas tenax]|uniref:hypothetical protein n=1 Tax=Epilithonimonas tenax TaxID=191577 RepID=UPI000405AE56|nr:hypothetical protein [Epilithonimonas tenax]
MENLAQNHLIKAASKLESYYGVDIVEWIEIIDFYINYYHHSEFLKRELYCAVEGYKNNELGCGVDSLLKTIDDFDIEERCSSAVNSDMFDMSLLKKFISNMAVSFAFNEPERQARYAEVRKQHAHLHNENLHNEN